MDVFKFRLQKVLELKELREREVARRLAAARQEADDARRVHDELSAAHAAGLDRLARAHGEAGSAGALQSLSSILAQLGQRVESAATDCQDADARALTELQMLTAAVRDRQLLTELRERQLLAWSEEQKSAERKLMDEIALTRHTRTTAPAEAK